MLIGWLLGMLDGALLATSIILTVLMPHSSWHTGIFLSIAMPLVALFGYWVTREWP